MIPMDSPLPQPKWRELCEKALFEADENRIMQRVADAQNAIDAARKKDCGVMTPRQEVSLRNAEKALQCLRSIYERRSRERKPPSGPFVIDRDGSLSE